MTLQQYLSQTSSLDHQLLAKKGELHYLSLLSQIELESGAPTLNDRKKLAKLEQDVSKEIHMLIAAKKKIREIVESIEDPKHRAVLTLRNICGLTWEEIGCQMGYSTRHAQRIYSTAIMKAQVVNHKKEVVACHANSLIF